VAILAVDEVWLREPRLLVPGQKPVGNVEVSGTYNVKHGCLFLVPSYKAIGTEGSSTTTIQQIAPVLYSAGHAETGASGNYLEFPCASVELYDNTFVFVFETPVAIPDYTGIASGSSTSGTVWKMYTTTGGTLTFAIFDLNIYLAGTSLQTAQKRHVLIATFTNVGGTYPFRATLYYSVMGSGVILSATGDRYPTLSGVGHRLGIISSNTPSRLNWEMFLVLGKAISDGEARSLCRDPFIPLIPA
jgi:hypothetical protein